MPISATLYSISERLNSTAGTETPTYLEYKAQPINYDFDSEIFSEVLAKYKYLKNLTEDHSPALIMIKDKESVKLPNGLSEKLQAISAELNFNSSITAIIEKFVLELYIKNDNQNIVLSKSSDDQFLMYVNDNGTYKNLLIDEEGDVELLIIPPDRKKTFNQMYFKSKGFDYSQIISKLNAMR